MSDVYRIASRAAFHVYTPTPLGNRYHLGRPTGFLDVPRAGSSVCLQRQTNNGGGLVYKVHPMDCVGLFACLLYVED